MKPITAEWIAKAENDYLAASQYLQGVDPPAYDLICFHAQQCVEKYLKASLQERDISFPKTHDLAKLLDLLTPSDEALIESRPDLDALSALAVSVRYPGHSATMESAQEALTIAQRVRHLCRGLLDLPPE